MSQTSFASPDLSTILRDVTNRLIILGTIPLHPSLERSSDLLANLLLLNDTLTITILVESDSETFSQSLLLDHQNSEQRTTYSTLSVHRERLLGRLPSHGLLANVRARLTNSPHVADIVARLRINQLNLRLPVSLILADDRLLCCVTTTYKPDITAYFEVDATSLLYKDLHELALWYAESPDGAMFLSQPGDELIQLYDRTGIPRGIFPRECFYATDYHRYSIWGIVFNRLGHLLLHQRASRAREGESLWDKSVGGHVDPRDPSTTLTAKRELVEEIYAPKAEFTHYLKAELGDIVHFGDWNTRKRPKSSFRDHFSALAPSDWVMFRATDSEGNPLTFTRVSQRRLTSDDGSVTVTPTVIRSDVFLFVSPAGLLDSHSRMKQRLRMAHGTGYAEDHRLISVEQLRDWIAEEDAANRASDVFTDDLVYLDRSHHALLQEFADFVKCVLAAPSIPAQ